MKKNDLIGLQLITLHEGKTVGSVKDVIYDPKSQQVKALEVEKGGLLPTSKTLMLQQIHSIGEDAVIIDSENHIDTVPPIEEPISELAEVSHKVEETRVITEEGKELGSIDDVIFEPDNGEITEFEMLQEQKKCGKSKKKRLILSHVLTVGEDVTVVSGYGENIFPENTAEKNRLAEMRSLNEENEAGKLVSQQAPDNISKSLSNSNKSEELADANRTLHTISVEDPQTQENKDKAKDANTKQVVEQTKEAGKGFVSSFTDWLVGPTIQEAISQLTGIPRKMPTETSSASYTSV